MIGSDGQSHPGPPPRKHGIWSQSRNSHPAATNARNATRTPRAVGCAITLSPERTPRTMGVAARKSMVGKSHIP